MRLPIVLARRARQRLELVPQASVENQPCDRAVLNLRNKGHSSAHDALGVDRTVATFDDPKLDFRNLGGAGRGGDILRNALA